MEERGEIEQNLIEIVARDLDRTTEDEEALARERGRKPDTFYSDLIYTLANIRYPDDEARLVWVDLLAHKAEMSSLLGRNVGVRVAALDFFRNKIGSLRNVKIVDSDDYIQTAKLAVIDGLTGVYNHRYFQDRLARSLDRASRDRVPVSLLMMDIDRFKRYNDRFGHMAGDVALREVASALRNAGPYKKERVLARYGGEEFATILYGAARAEALEEAERLRGEVEALSALRQAQDRPALSSSKGATGPDVTPAKPAGSPRAGRLTISVGVATYPEDASDRDGLIDWADLSLYLAKTGGRNRVVSCPVDHTRAGRFQTDIEARLRRAASPEKQYRKFTIIDISGRGIGLAGEGLPASGSRVEIILSGRGLGEPITTKARVAWRRAESRLGELAGAEFVGMPREVRDRLTKWLASPPDAPGLPEPSTTTKDITAEDAKDAENGGKQGNG